MTWDRHLGALSLGLSGGGHRAPTPQIRYLLLDDGINLMVFWCVMGGSLIKVVENVQENSTFATFQDVSLHVRSVELAAATLSL